MRRRYLSALVLAAVFFSLHVPTAMLAGCGPPVSTATGWIRPPSTKLWLIQPLNVTATCATLSYAPGVQIFLIYFNRVWPWVAAVAAGIAVLQGLIGGMMILTSGGGEGRQKGIEKLTAAAVGILLVGFFGFILRFLNSYFFL